MSERVRFDFSGCRVVVTGGTSGIGHAIAQAFAEAGARVLITGRKPEAAHYERDLTRFEYFALELTQRAAIQRFAASLERVDVLVNNGGANFPFEPSEWEPETFERSLALNLSAPFHLSLGCHALLKASRWPGGAAIVNLASMSSYFAVPPVPAYGAAKAGIVQLSKALGVAWASDGIRVNAVAPGLVETGMTQAMKGVPALEGPPLARTPLGRWGQPEDITGAVLFLASPAAAFVTGQTWNVDGGYSAG